VQAWPCAFEFCHRKVIKIYIYAAHFSHISSKSCNFQENFHQKMRHNGANLPNFVFPRVWRGKLAGKILGDVL